jgi:hypothetical protein
VNRRRPIEILRSPYSVTGALAIQGSDHILDGVGLIGDWAASLLASGLFDVPALIDKSEEAVAQSERRLHREVRQIVQSEKRGVAALLLLPGSGAIRPDASQDTSAIRTFRDLNQEHGPLLRGFRFRDRH